MPITDYRVLSHWRVRGSVDEVAAVFARPETWSSWWPAAFLEVADLGCEGVDDLSARRAWIHSKGWLPYTLQLEVSVLECRYPRACTFLVHGDFEGRCDCSLDPAGEGQVDLRFDWRVSVRKRLVRNLTWLLKPIFVANHRWVMRQGRRSLEIELERRRRQSAGAGYAQLPPGPTFPYGGSWPRVARWWRRRLAGPVRRPASGREAGLAGARGR